MNTDVFILARSTSNRLPRKHLREIQGKPIIENLVNRIKKSKLVRKVVVCTTNLASDDEFAEILKEKDIECFRGEDKDIIKRLYDAAKQFNTDIIIDVSGDKIYTDIDYLDKVIRILENEDIDFVRGNNSESKFDPGDLFVHGFIPGGFKIKALEIVYNEKTTDNTEDGYTEFFIKNKSIKKKYIVPIELEKYSEKIKLDLDYSEDLILAKQIFEELGNNFKINDILSLFAKKPELVQDSKAILAKWKKNYAEKTLKLRKD